MPFFEVLIVVVMFGSGATMFFGLTAMFTSWIANRHDSGKKGRFFRAKTLNNAVSLVANAVVEPIADRFRAYTVRLRLRNRPDTKRSFAAAIVTIVAAAIPVAFAKNDESIVQGIAVIAGASVTFWLVVGVFNAANVLAGKAQTPDFSPRTPRV